MPAPSSSPRWPLTRVDGDVVVLELAGCPDEEVPAAVTGARATLARDLHPRLVIDVGRRRALSGRSIDALASACRGLHATGGQAALVVEPPLAAQISIRHPDGIPCASTRGLAVAMLARRSAVSVRTDLSSIGRRLTIRIAGVLDASTCPSVEAASSEATAFAHPRRAVILDLSRLKGVDAAGWQAILGTAIQCQLAGARVSVAHAPPHALDVLVQLDWYELVSELVVVPSIERSACGWVNGYGPSAHARSATRPFGGLRRASPLNPAPEDFEDCLEAVIVTDLAGRVTHWNRAAERLYGWTDSEVIGRPITELTVGPRDHDAARAILQAVLADGAWEGEFEVRAKDGRSFTARVHNELVRDQAGKPAAFVGRSREATGLPSGGRGESRPSRSRRSERRAA